MRLDWPDRVSPGAQAHSCKRKRGGARNRGIHSRQPVQALPNLFAGGPAGQRRQCPRGRPHGRLAGSSIHNRIPAIPAASRTHPVEQHGCSHATAPRRTRGQLRGASVAQGKQRKSGRLNPTARSASPTPSAQGVVLADRASITGQAMTQPPPHPALPRPCIAQPAPGRPPKSPSNPPSGRGTQPRNHRHAGSAAESCRHLRSGLSAPNDPAPRAPVPPSLLPQSRSGGRENSPSRRRGSEPATGRAHKIHQVSPTLPRARSRNSIGLRAYKCRSSCLARIEGELQRALATMHAADAFREGFSCDYGRECSDDCFRPGITQPAVAHFETAALSISGGPLLFLYHLDVERDGDLIADHAGVGGDAKTLAADLCRR